MDVGKLFFVSNTAWSLFNFRLPLMRHLKSQGMEIYAVTSYDEFAKKLEKEFLFIALKHIDRKRKSVFKDFLFLYELYKIYKQYMPDLVLHFTIKPNIYGSIACGFLGIPSIANVTGLGYVFVKGGILKELVKILYRLSFKKSQKVIFQNLDDLKLFLQEKIVEEKKCLIIPGSGVNTEKFSPEFCKKFSYKEKNQKTCVFLMISRVLWDKGVGEFVKAAKIIRGKYQNTEFWLLGAVDKGNPSAVPYELLDKWQKEGIVKYLGITEDVRPFICQSDVVVLPSYYREGIPRALLEAMAMAKPIITTDTPGCRETVVDGVNGFMVKPKDVSSLVEAMEKFLNLSQGEREKMGLEGRKMVLEKFDERIVIEKYIKIIKEIISKRK